eukprot:TRINITY_DN14259_c0_g1_i1.p1 TRINITY_DN14259_c0_g1~~TRINITY_DN14259_c0_g1_i1.p1  ORF type:complete len:196 (-),score=54.91 TRINITY_DN14259_c0_g1_i1:60-623(-)
MRKKNLFWFALLSIISHRILKIIVNILKQSKSIENNNENNENIEIIENNNKINSKKIFLKSLIVIEKFLAFIFGSCVFYLLTCEFSSIYCNGRTIISHNLTNFSSYLQRNNKYELCLKVLNFCKWWDGIWLGGENNLMKENYKNLSKIHFLLGQPKQAIIYSNLLSNVNYENRKKNILGFFQSFLSK